MTKPSRVCVAVIDHAPDPYLDDLIGGLRRFFPEAEVVWYDTGTTCREPPGVPRLRCSRVHSYAKITAVFFDLFEWWLDRGDDYLINLETDVAVVDQGVDVITGLMREVDYMAPRLIGRVPATSRWRPYHSLSGELPELLDILGVDTVQGAFSPAQVFTKRYVRQVLESSFYSPLRDFLERNKAPDRSFSLQEVLLPTLAQACGLRSRSYPAEHERFNRYRPYHALSSVRAARAASIPFVHPVRRSPGDNARQYVRKLVAFGS